MAAVILDEYNPYGDNIVIIPNGGGSQNPPEISGVDDIMLNEGDEFDPMAGVTATDSKGNPVDVTVSGEVDLDTPGEYTLTYTATDEDGKTTTITRKVTVVETNAPIINGVTDIKVNQGIWVDLKDGVEANPGYFTNGGAI